MYCDIFNEACHDDPDIKMATGNDAYDWQPEISCERKFLNSSLWTVFARSKDWISTIF